jgi:hypothetical protein
MRGHRSPASLLERVWLWGMRPNVLQESHECQAMPGFDRTSRITAEESMKRTGIANLVIAGGLEINQETLSSVPSARRIICKWSAHEYVPNEQPRPDIAGCLQRLFAAKKLSATDRRVDAFLLDDLSTGSMTAGVGAAHIAELQRENASCWPHLPLYGTIYPQSLDRPGLAEVIAHLDLLVMPLWHVEEVESLPRYLERCNELSGGKPIIACLYFYDFGKSQMISRDQMRRQLDVLTGQMELDRVTGAVFCGTCMLDIGWESVDCWFDWLRELGGVRSPAATVESYALRANRGSFR